MSARTPSVLVVERDDDKALAAEELLEDAQCYVETVASIADAAHALLRFSFDIVILGSSAREADAEFIQVLQRDSGGRQAPVFMIPLSVDGAVPGSSTAVCGAQAVSGHTLGDLLKAVRAALELPPGARR